MPCSGHSLRPPSNLSTNALCPCGVRADMPVCSRGSEGTVVVVCDACISLTLSGSVNHGTAGQVVIGCCGCDCGGADRARGGGNRSWSCWVYVGNTWVSMFLFPLYSSLYRVPGSVSGVKGVAKNTLCTG